MKRRQWRRKHCEKDTKTRKISSTYTAASKILAERMERKIETTSLKSVEHSRELTEKCLRTAYFVGYHNRPFTDYPELATLQSANGIKLGSILHTRSSCTQVIKCIADAMRQKYVKQLRTMSEKLLLSQRLYKKNMSLISVS